MLNIFVLILYRKLIKISGSKYVHSYIENTYQKVKEDLLNDKIVLFVGNSMPGCRAKIVFRKRL